jgi:hypothetical protein
LFDWPFFLAMGEDVLETRQYNPCLMTVLVLLALLLGETLIRYVVCRAMTASDADRLRTRLAQPASHIARIMLLLVALAILLCIWLVDVFGAVTVEQWPNVSRSWLKVGRRRGLRDRQVRHGPERSARWPCPRTPG